MISITSCRKQWLPKSGIRKTKLLFMHNQQGFVGLPVLLAILIGIVVLGGGAYYVVQQQPPTQPASENILDNSQANTTATQSLKVLLPQGGEKFSICQT